MQQSTGQWLQNLVIKGREENDDPYERDDKGAILVEDDEKVLKEGWEYNEKDEPVKVDPEGENETEEPTLEDLQEKIRDTEEALRKERQLRRKAERDARAKKKQTPADKSKVDDETSERLRTSEARTAKLAKGLLDNKLDQAILAEARRQKFIDESDALSDAIRAEIDYDQDDDDPSDIEIDEETVKDAVASLAAKKKHLIRDSEGSSRERETPGSSSGSRLRKNRNKNQDTPNEQALAGYYPSLGG